jgi:hypothetical protein
LHLKCQRTNNFEYSGFHWELQNIFYEIMNEIQELISLDHSFNLVMLAIEQVQKIHCEPLLINAVFHAYRSGDRSSKDYVFYNSPCLSVTGHVDKGFPKTVWIKVQGEELNRVEINRVFKNYYLSFHDIVKPPTKQECENLFKLKMKSIVGSV